MGAALNASGIAVTFECDPPLTDAPWPRNAEQCNLWAAHDDVEDDFLMWTLALDDIQTWDLAQYARPGAWNLPDILRLGEGGQTHTEYQAQVSLYALLAAPFIIGTDLRTASKEIISLYLAPEVLRMQQDPLGEQGGRVSATPTPGPGGLEVWARNLTTGMALGLFNRADAPSNITAVFRALGLPDRVALRDLWKRQEVGTYTDQITLTVDSHACVLLLALPS